jgi:hypothetical protein
MAHQIEVHTRDEDLLGTDVAGRDMAGVVTDLNDELTVICAYANMGAEVSYDAEQTESYFAMIEAAGKKAAQITEQLVVALSARPSEDTHSKAVAWPAALDPIPAIPGPSAEPQSSFRRRLTAARAVVTG